MCEKTFLGIELGSTRIKALLIGENHEVLAEGGFEWENRLENGFWTYSLDEVWNGLQETFKSLSNDFSAAYGTKIHTLGGLGISAMMHGYLVFDKNWRQLVPFRTWRNTRQEQAANELTALLNFNIPQRWSIAHMYQAILNKEPHVHNVAHLTTLAGYIHYKLTGNNVVGIGEASGMFPVDSKKFCYDAERVEKINKKFAQENLPYTLHDIFPHVLVAGENAGKLTVEGAKLLDPTGTLKEGIPLCPPEGDAGTGMVATNSIAARTGNVSAGTSIFAMSVLEKPLSKLYTEIDMVTTPDGKPVAMAHCNNCTSDINAWAEMLCGFAQAAGLQLNKGKILDTLFESALEGDSDCGGVLSYNYFSGEHITCCNEGRPILVRLPNADFTFANFARSHLFSATATLSIGMNILFEKENVKLDVLFGHGGFFKAKNAGQQIMAAAMNVPISVMETANKGGAWGMAILAAFSNRKANGETLDTYLAQKVFKNAGVSTVKPNKNDVAGFENFMKKYKSALGIEKAAIKDFS